ncbi:MAG: DUF58 domain-containing protein [Anaerolineae bacterium]|nr:DUF58 domain-containing protein [Anaerolineae bacterium]
MKYRRQVEGLIILFILGIIIKLPGVPKLTAAILTVMAIGYWWGEKALSQITYRREFHYTRAFPGEEIPAALEIKNNKFLPVSWLRARDPWPKAVGPLDNADMSLFHSLELGRLVNVFSLRWFESARREYILRFRKRGVYEIGPVQLESGDVFGIYKNIQIQGKAEKLTVFPELLPLADLGLPAEDPFGDLKSPRMIFEDPNRPMGVREYRPEDELRRVHWPATARTGQMQVKVYEPTTNQVMVVCLDAATGENIWEGIYEELLEHLISLAGSILYHGMQSGYQIGLISNGAVGSADRSLRILPGRSAKHLANLLSLLAGVSPVVIAPFDRFLISEISRVPYGATLVLVSAVTTSSLQDSIMRLKKHGWRMVLISLAEASPPPLPGIKTIHLPFKEAASPPEAV